MTPNYHGADWKAMKAKYAAFLPHLSCRADLNRLIQWMCSELGVGHHRVGGGDFLAQPARVPGGLLGADYAVENARYRFKKIYGGLNWTPELRAPLAEPGAEVAAGEYLLAVEGRDLVPPDNLFARFEATAGKIVEIRVGPDPGGAGSRTIKVVPIADEGALRNRDWVEGNIRKVHEATNGRVAYVYVPNTTTLGHVYFKRYFFPQADKEAIIVDERFNGGGSVADYYLDWLRKPVSAYWAMRSGADLKTPSASIQGPKVMLINETAGSGGDLLPYMWRKFGLGKLVGTATWGGLVGILGIPGAHGRRQRDRAQPGLLGRGGGLRRRERGHPARYRGRADAEGRHRRPRPSARGRHQGGHGRAQGRSAREAEAPGVSDQGEEIKKGTRTCRVRVPEVHVPVLVFLFLDLGLERVDELADDGFVRLHALGGSDPEDHGPVLGIVGLAGQLVALGQPFLQLDQGPLIGLLALVTLLPGQDDVDRGVAVARGPDDRLGFIGLDGLAFFRDPDADLAFGLVSPGLLGDDILVRLRRDLDLELFELFLVRPELGLELLQRFFERSEVHLLGFDRLDLLLEGLDLLQHLLVGRRGESVGMTVLGDPGHLVRFARA